MKEIGGYIELDKHNGSIYHENAIALNCGRTALEYILKARNIKYIYLPYFCCDSISQPCKKCSVDVTYYHIDKHFNPILPNTLPDNAWLYFVNYYGQFDNDKLRKYKNKYPNLIIDNAQAYFQTPVDNTDTLYTCRKFFGVADGAFLYTNSKLEIFEQDESFERMHFLLGRFERTASEFYSEYSDNNKLFADEPIKRMSKLTDNLLKSINYDFARERRKQNFKYLHKKLASINKLNLVIPDGAFMYPFYIDNGSDIRKKLQAEKIYIPTLWPDVFEFCKEDDIEYDMAKNILPLPIDQRYDEDDMEYMFMEIQKCID